MTDKIISYPAPSDLSYEGDLAYPVKLKKGFLLDRRGIGKNTVFTKFTYEEYSAMKTAPLLADLYESIIDPEPFEVIYYCGKNNNQKGLIKELNKKITEGFNECDKIE